VGHKTKLSLKLYKARQAVNLTIEEAAYRIGVSDRLIRYYESGERRPSIERILIICEVYKVSISELFD
jgi:transcriptional regulator with XRE-family HTH domain